MCKLFKAGRAFWVFSIKTALAAVAVLLPASSTWGRMERPAATAAWAAPYTTELLRHKSHCPMKFKLPNERRVVRPGRYVVPRNDQIATVTQATIWQDVSGSVFRTIYGGSNKKRPTYGIIVASYNNLCTGQGWTTWSTTSSHTGPLSLVSVSGDVVLFSFRGGHGSFSFSTTRFTVSKKR